MEISIKATGGDRVVIEISQAEAANVLDQAERAGKVPALEAQVRALKDDLNSVRGRLEAERDAARVQIDQLKAERDALQIKVTGYDHDRHTERDRADENQREREENRLWAERTEALLEKAQHELTQVKNNLVLVKAELMDPEARHSERVSNALRILT